MLFEPIFTVMSDNIVLVPSELFYKIEEELELEISSSISIIIK